MQCLLANQNQLSIGILAVSRSELIFIGRSYLIGEVELSNEMKNGNPYR